MHCNKLTIRLQVYQWEELFTSEMLGQCIQLAGPRKVHSHMLQGSHIRGPL